MWIKLAQLLRQAINDLVPLCCLFEGNLRGTALVEHDVLLIIIALGSPTVIIIIIIDAVLHLGCSCLSLLAQASVPFHEFHNSDEPTVVPIHDSKDVLAVVFGIACISTVLEEEEINRILQPAMTYENKSAFMSGPFNLPGQMQGIQTI